MLKRKDCAGAALEDDNAFRNFQFAVRSGSILQDELLKLFLVRALVTFVNESPAKMSVSLPRSTVLEILNTIMTKAKICAGDNFDTSFRCGGERIKKLKNEDAFRSIVFHELGHYLIRHFLPVGDIATIESVTPELLADVASMVPALVLDAAKYPGQVRKWHDSARGTGLHIHCSQSRPAGHSITQFSLSARPVFFDADLPAFWCAVLMRILEIEPETAVAAFSEHGVFHLVVPGHGPGFGSMSSNATATRHLLPADILRESRVWLDGLVRAGHLASEQTELNYLLRPPVEIVTEVRKTV